jgi:Flp pilus assembly pilin Flp
MTIRHYLTRFVRDEAGAAGVEYGILVAAVAAGIIVAAFSIGDRVAAAFDYVDGEIATGCPECAAPAPAPAP